MEHAIVLEDGKISVAVDAGTGYTTLIRNPADESGMNWILGNSNWGHTDGFEIQSVEKKENSVIVSGINRADFLNLVIEKKRFKRKIYRKIPHRKCRETRIFPDRGFFRNSFPVQL